MLFRSRHGARQGRPGTERGRGRSYRVLELPQVGSVLTQDGLSTLLEARHPLVVPVICNVGLPRRREHREEDVRKTGRERQGEEERGEGEIQAEFILLMPVCSLIWCMAFKTHYRPLM